MYLIQVLTKDNDKISVKVSILHPDFERINAKEYDFEQYCLKFLVDAYSEMKPDLEGHPLKTKYDYWCKLAYGEEIELTPEEAGEWASQRFYPNHRKIVARKGSAETGLTLCLEPEYRQFCFEAQDHISHVKSSKHEDGDEVISFVVKNPAMLAHVAVGVSWKSNAYNYWSLWVNEVHPRLRAAGAL